MLGDASGVTPDANEPGRAASSPSEPAIRTQGDEMAVTKIDHYEVMYSSNTFPPRLWLYGGGKPLGQLIFMPDGSSLPPDTLSSGQANLHYHLENLDTMLRLFQSEKTLYLLWTGSGGGNENGIQTTEQVLGA
jgi:hypothetical protein